MSARRVPAPVRRLARRLRQAPNAPLRVTAPAALLDVLRDGAVPLAAAAAPQGTLRIAVVVPSFRQGSGGHGTTAPTATSRAQRAERRSPARSHASATNDEPAARPPSQKYSGTSQVHTGAFIIPRCTASGISGIRLASSAGASAA